MKTTPKAATSAFDLNALERQRLHQLLDDAGYEALRKAVWQERNFDLELFTFSFVRRAVSSFMAVRGMDAIPRLLDFLRKDQDHWASFVSELVPPATELFREPEVWSHLYHETPRQPSHPFQGEKLRIWVHGVTSGEVLASTLIFLHEKGWLQKSDILATDIHAHILRRAAQMRLIKSKWTPSLKNYGRLQTGRDQPAGYREHDYEWRLAPEYLERVRFRQQLPHSPPEGHASFDMILCRNVLLYYKPSIAQKACYNMVKRLKPGGYLFMGGFERPPASILKRQLIPVMADNCLFCKIQAQ